MIEKDTETIKNAFALAIITLCLGTGFYLLCDAIAIWVVR